MQSTIERLLSMFVSLRDDINNALSSVGVFNGLLTGVNNFFNDLFNFNRNEPVSASFSISYELIADLIILICLILSFKAIFKLFDIMIKAIYNFFTLSNVERGLNDEIKSNKKKK